MGKVVVLMSVSADGLFEGLGGDISWHRVDAEVHREFNEVLFAAGALLSGRVTHEMMAEFWPFADEDPHAEAELKEFAAYWRGARKYVLSTTLDAEQPWNSTIIRSFDAVAIRELANSIDGDLFVGGGSVIDECRRADLVDEWRLYIHPVVVGSGRPLLAAGHAPSELSLLETRRFSNGVVLTRYSVVRPGDREVIGGSSR
jgi:dihydrofolate reductase